MTEVVFTLTDCPIFWQNFILYEVNPDGKFGYGPKNNILEAIDERMKEYHGRKVGNTLIFESESDLIYFKMRWS